MRKSLVLALGLVMALMIAPSANAAVTSVFNNETSPLLCVADAAPPAPIPANSRFCGSHPGASTVESFDGTPIDVSVALPPDPGGVETQRAVVGIYHGWGGSKVNLRTDPLAQNLLANGFIVFTMTDRGWGNSCGGPFSGGQGQGIKPAPCASGYIHLMHNAYEVRDAQFVLGKLADDKEDTDANYLIDADSIGAAGGSYGGGMSAALAMLKDRVQLPNGSYTPWDSDVDNRPMAVAAAAPQYTWSDLSQALAPNGSSLDYAKQNPYYGAGGNNRVGVNKQQWVYNLYMSGVQTGYYAPPNVDPSANMIGWYAQLSAGGPFDGNTNVSNMLSEIQNNHSSYYIPINNTSQTPAPMLISGGWNDDLFPVDESVRLYNKVRADSPSTPVVVWGLDIGHTPRSNGDAATRAADMPALIGTQVVWMMRYLRSIPAPWPLAALGFNPNGGAVATSSKCGPGSTRVAGDLSVAASWVELAPGEVQVESGDAHTIKPSTKPADQFVSTHSSQDVCDFASRTDDTEGAAVYKSEPAGSGGYTIIGSPTIDAVMDVKSGNDQVIARLYDLDPSGTTYQRLISRAIYRPTGVGAGPSKQTFQLYPQNYQIPAGHQVKLELLSSDSPYAQNTTGVAQQPIVVSSLKLALPVKEASGAADGQVTGVTPKTLPAGYEMNDAALATDSDAPTTTDDVPSTLQQSVTVTLDAVDTGISGVEATYYEIGAAPATPTPASPVYNPASKPVLLDGQKISYYSVDHAGNVETPVKTSIAAQVDNTAPAAPTLVTGPAATIDTNTASIAFSSPELGATFKCSLDGGAAAACGSPAVLNGLANGAHTFSVTATDSVGNVGSPLTVNFTVQGKISAKAAVSGKARVGKTLTAKPSASAFGAALSGVKYKYSWTANGKKAGSKSKLKLTKKHKGKKIVLKVTATKTGYKSGTATKTVTKKLK